MSRGGSVRGAVARRLRAAYAAGLLSDDTYAHRVDALLGSRVVDPVWLSGDLAERRRRPTLLETVRDGVARLRGRLAGGEDPEVLLALDWGGLASELMVGRHHGCDVVLTDPGVSRRHAQLRCRDGHWIVQDLESRNGTFVNGVRVGRCELRPGDAIAFGATRLLVD